MNFKQRWVKATRWKEFGRRIKSKANWHADSLINIERISWIISPPIPDVIDDIITCIPKEEPSVWVSAEDDPETWHVQVVCGCSRNKCSLFNLNIFKKD